MLQCGLKYYAKEVGLLNDLSATFSNKGVFSACPIALIKFELIVRKVSAISRLLNISRSFPTPLDIARISYLPYCYH